MRRLLSSQFPAKARAMSATRFESPAAPLFARLRYALIDFLNVDTIDLVFKYADEQLRLLVLDHHNGMSYRTGAHGFRSEVDVEASHYERYVAPPPQHSFVVSYSIPCQQWGTKLPWPHAIQPLAVAFPYMLLPVVSIDWKPPDDLETPSRMQVYKLSSDLQQLTTVGRSLPFDFFSDDDSAMVYDKTRNRLHLFPASDATAHYMTAADGADPWVKLAPPPMENAVLNIAVFPERLVLCTEAGLCTYDFIQDRWTSKSFRHDDPKIASDYQSAAPIFLDSSTIFFRDESKRLCQYEFNEPRFCYLDFTQPVVLRAPQPGGDPTLQSLTLSPSQELFVLTAMSMTELRINRANIKEKGWGYLYSGCPAWMVHWL